MIMVIKKEKIDTMLVSQFWRCNQGEILKGFKKPHIGNLSSCMSLWSRVSCLLTSGLICERKVKQKNIVLWVVAFLLSVCFSLACSLTNTFPSYSFQIKCIIFLYLTWNFAGFFPLSIPLPVFFFFFFAKKCLQQSLASFHCSLLSLPAGRAHNVNAKLCLA